jgi:alanine racemase
VIAASRALGKKAVCHIKLETGMGRIGARKPAVIKIFSELSASKSAVVGGLYTHLSSADTDPEFTARQLGYFDETVSGLAGYGVTPPPDRPPKAGLVEKAVEAARSGGGMDKIIRHAANSAGLINYPQSRLDMVRAGLAAYGLMDNFEPVLSWKTRIVFIKTVREGAYISYNKSFRAPRPMKIATIPVGYGDGYIRRFSGARVLVGGVRCPVAGNVTMDMTMVDVTDARDASVGSEVTLIGRQGGAEITAGELAALAGTIPYEIVTLITSRVPRIYT